MCFCLCFLIIAVCGLFIHDSVIDLPEYFVLKQIYVSFQYLYLYIVSQVKHVRRETTGSNGFPANFGSSTPTGTFSDFFRWFPTSSYRKVQTVGRNPPEKIRKTSGRNTASISEGFPVVSCGIRWPESSNWDIVVLVDCRIYSRFYCSSFKLLYKK